MISQAKCYFLLIANYFILVQLANLEKIFPMNQKAFYPEILHSRILFSYLNWKVKCLRLNLKSNVTISSNQIMKLDM